MNSRAEVLERLADRLDAHAERLLRKYGWDDAGKAEDLRDIARELRKSADVRDEQAA